MEKENGRGWGEQGGQLVEPAARSGGWWRRLVAATAPQGRMALVLRHRWLTPPGPRPHDRRMARAFLDDIAVRHDGQVFALGNGDMVLLSRRRQVRAPCPRGHARDAAGAARHSAAGSPDPAEVAAVWPLTGTPRAHRLCHRTAESVWRAPRRRPTRAPGEVAEQTVAVAAIVATAEGSHARRLQPPHGGRAGRERSSGTLHRAQAAVPEVRFSIAALEARLAATARPRPIRFCSAISQAGWTRVCWCCSPRQPAAVARSTSRAPRGRAPQTLGARHPVRRFARLTAAAAEAAAASGSR